MAPFAVGPFRSKYNCLLSGPLLCSSRHDPGFCFKAKECVRFFPPIIIRGGWEGLVLSDFLLRTVVRSFVWLERPFAKKHRSDSCFALLCAFRVWLLSLSGRLAVDTKTCSTALLHAHPAMTRFVLRQRQIQKQRSL